MKPRMTDVVLPPTFEQTAGAGSAQPTPGPWKTRLRHAIITIYGADGIQVLETSWHPEIRKSYPLKAEAVANAKLAAAAPELLAELQDVLEWALLEKAPLREQEIASIRAAIAKAKGGAA